ncbi:MAG TPA: UDP-glucose 4-epimerase GalE [Ruminococcus sp.]|nr:UDP-glucose 4-epimerase GalE [Ruminococcus sp.]
MSTIFLAGGAGYIGSHTAVELLNAGYEVVAADNFVNSSPEAIRRVEEITGKSVKLYEADIRDHARLAEIFRENRVDAVIHFAGLKAVGESVAKPVLYYRNNIDTTLTLLETMAEFGVKNIIFSSSATVYGEENPIPYLETMPRGVCTNPYGWTKAMMEQIFEDAAKADPTLSVVLLRYFNPIGAHPSGRIGEDPQGIPNNLMPYVTQVAAGKRECLTIFGNDYPTKDGTCGRDYIHVVDLAVGHVKAVDYILKHDGVEIFNLGTGIPYSVTDIVETFERVNHIKVNHVYGARRAGDLPEYYANSDKALAMLGWKTEHTLEDMCRDSWNWQKNNPNGYADAGK